MLIGVMSDTHDRLDSLIRAVKIFADNKVEALVHCGDWVSPFTIEYFDSICGDLRVPIHSVFGNNEGDIRRIIERNSKLKNPIHFTSKQTLELNFDNRRIIVYHGQDKTLKKAIIKANEYDALFTGHTHEPLNTLEGKMLVLNPGSTSYTAHSQVIDKASVAVYNTQTNTAEILYF